MKNDYNNVVNIGYYQQPTIQGNQVIFVCESDLWKGTVDGGQARRLTFNKVMVSSPMLSPNGKQIAFVSLEDGTPEIYIMSSDGGNEQRLTYQGSFCHVCDWSKDGKNILYASIVSQPFQKYFSMWQISSKGGIPSKVKVGPASRISYSDTGSVVICRNEQLAYFWKRYKGGREGDFWVDVTGKSEFSRILENLDGNPSRPMWIGDRIYFLSDHEGWGNLYSCLADGSDLCRETDHSDFYVRAATTDSHRIVYQCGAKIFLYEPSTGKEREIKFIINSTKPQLRRRFVSAEKHLQSYDIHPKGHSILINSRGKLFSMGNWEREVYQYGTRNGVRYRHSKWLWDGEQIVTISDEGGEEALEIHTLPNSENISLDTTTLKKRIEGLDTGRITSLVVSPKSADILASNQRNELLLIDLENEKVKIVDRSNFSEIKRMTFSPDGKWVAYSAEKNNYFPQIFLYSIDSDKITTVTSIAGIDTEPVFDTEGKYLFFISYRIFNPVYDTMRFDIGFPLGGLIYVVTLQKDLESPFDPPPRPLNLEAKDKSSNSNDALETQETKVSLQSQIQIDLEGIQHRIIPFPIKEGRYSYLSAIKGKIFYVNFPIKGALQQLQTTSKKKGDIKVFDFNKLEESTFLEGVDSFKANFDGTALACRIDKKLRVISSKSKPESDSSKPSRASGWIDLSRIKLSIIPQKEWQQMYRELWRLQREHYWTQDMAGINWEEVYERYKPILNLVSTRFEFSDFNREVNGELGTSHAYEMGGDKPVPPPYGIGRLAADFSFNGKNWVFEHIIKGFSWEEQADSPLNSPGLNIKEGDELLAIDGIPLSQNFPPEKLLVNRSNQQVSLLVRLNSNKKVKRLHVKTLKSDIKARYREWVERNRTYIHKESGDVFGYIHLPDMSAGGYAEFFKYFIPESLHNGLIVDVRYNSGGHVSQLLLEKLMRRRRGYSISHHSAPEPIPSYSIPGPIVAITDQFAGSDGDIFSHSFKMLKLGKLVGKRTWGGVVGISSHSRLADGTLVTQPEFAIWFNDVGYGIENRGTEPDIEVEIKPQDWIQNKDTQLETALITGMKLFEKNPLPEYNFKRTKNLAIKKLPPRK